MVIKFLIGGVMLAIPGMVSYDAYTNINKYNDLLRPIAILPDSSISSSVQVKSNNQSIEKKENEANAFFNENTVRFILCKSAFIIPLIAVEILLIFFFRILLTHYNSVTAQILQLNMRRALLQFIEEYVKFKKGNADSSYDKLESLIFSNLMPNAEQVPSTFDGFDQIGKIIEKLKGGDGK